MRLISFSLFLVALASAGEQPAKKFPVSKETTFVIGPLDQDGYIDYQTALNDLLGKGVVPEKNANVLIWKAIGPKPGGERMPAEFFTRLGIEEPSAEGTYFINLRDYLRKHAGLDFDQVDAIDKQLEQASQRPWKAEDYPLLAKWLKVNEKPLSWAVKAAQCPTYFNPLVAPRKGKELRSMASALHWAGPMACREMVSALLARAMLRVQEGKSQEAWKDLLACHRLGRLLSRGSTMIEGLFGIAYTAMTCKADETFLEHGRLSAKQVRACLKDLQALPSEPCVADKTSLAERFLYLDSIQLVHRGRVDQLNLKRSGTPTVQVKQALAAVEWGPALREVNRWFDRMTAALRLLTRTEREKALDNIEEELAKLNGSVPRMEDLLANAARVRGVGQPDRETGRKICNILISQVVPMHRRVQEGYDRTQQIVNNVQLAFALAAYQREHGYYPAKLDELAPQYVPAVPDDLFSGKALVYRPFANGYLLYSVGVNGRDDGGRGRDDDPACDDLAIQIPGRRPG